MSKQLKIGDKLYKRAGISGTLEYEVLSITEQRDAKFYTIECLSCQHGRNCEVLITDDEHGKFRYVRTLDDDVYEPQHPFHIDAPNERYCRTREEATIESYEHSIREQKKSIAQIKERLESEEKLLARIEQALEDILNPKIAESVAEVTK